MSTTAIVLRKDKSISKEQIPLYLRITKNRKSSYKSLNVRIAEKHWDSKQKKVKSNHPNSNRLNLYLASRITEAEKQILNDENLSNGLIAKDLVNSFDKNDTTNFNQFSQEYLERLWEVENFSRHKKLKSILSKLCSYNKCNVLMFNEITVDFLQKYESWLRVERKNSVNTIHSNMKFIRQLFNEAVKQKVIRADQNPFLLYKLKQEKTEREFLTDEEIDHLYSLKLDGTKEICRDMFVFACDTGIRISDLLTIKVRHYDNKRLTFQMRKTKPQVSILLPTRAQRIISRYIETEESKNEFAFQPFKKKSFTKMGIEKAIMSKTALFNSILKELAELAEIEKHLTFHVSRHSFGTRALRKGIRIEQVSKLMGHSDLKTTMVYTKIVNTNLDEAMKAFN